LTVKPAMTLQVRKHDQQHDLERSRGSSHLIGVKFVIRDRGLNFTAAFEPSSPTPER
jgi:hypothetical protein